MSRDGKLLATVLGPGGRKLGAAIWAVKRSLSRPVYLPSRVMKLIARICLRIIAKKSWSIVAIRADGAGYKNIAEFDHDIGIVLPSPNSPDVVYFPKPEFELWTMKIDGSGNRPLYGPQEKMWLTDLYGLTNMKLCWRNGRRLWLR